jgi:diacylglycerol kinase (ATP)
VSATGWIVPLLVLAAIVLLGAAVVVGRRPSRSADALDAAPDDRPLPVVVVNPVKVDDVTRERIAAVCTDLGWADPVWLETTPDDPGTGQAREAVDRGADVVLACGGDGTVRAVAHALSGTGVAMGLLPAGTGNLLARALGTPLEMVAATRVALTGDDRAIDVGMVRVGEDESDEQTFLVMAGTGMDAAIMQSTPEALKDRVGPLAYVVSGLRALRGRRTRVTVRLDGGATLRRSSRTVVVGNSGTLPAGLVLMPDATLDDGRLDVVNLAPKGVVGWFVVLLRVATRKRRGHPRVEHWQAATVEIATDAPQAAQIDGDPIGEVSRLRMRVDPQALVVRVEEAR